MSWPHAKENNEEEKCGRRLWKNLEVGTEEGTGDQSVEVQTAWLKCFGRDEMVRIRRYPLCEMLRFAFDAG